MSGIHLFGRLEALLSLTTKITSRTPPSDPIKRSWYIKTALFRVQDRTIRLTESSGYSYNRRPPSDASNYFESCYGLINISASARRERRNSSSFRQKASLVERGYRPWVLERTLLWNHVPIQLSWRIPRFGSCRLNAGSVRAASLASSANPAKELILLRIDN